MQTGSAAGAMSQSLGEPVPQNQTLPVVSVTATRGDANDVSVVVHIPSSDTLTIHLTLTINGSQVNIGGTNVTALEAASRSARASNDRTVAREVHPDPCPSSQSICNGNGATGATNVGAPIATGDVATVATRRDNRVVNKRKHTTESDGTLSAARRRLVHEAVVPGWNDTTQSNVAVDHASVSSEAMLVTPDREPSAAPTEELLLVRRGRHGSEEPGNEAFRQAVRTAWTEFRNVHKAGDRNGERVIISALAQRFRFEMPLGAKPDEYDDRVYRKIYSAFRKR